MKKSYFVRRWAILILTVCMSLLFSFASAEETILVDNENVTFQIVGFAEDPIWGQTMNVYLENKTDKTLVYTIEACAINGVMNDPFWATEVLPGSKANESISWMSPSGNASSAGITKLDFTLRISDSEDFMAEPVFNQSFSIYPVGEENVVPDVYSIKESDIVLFDTDDAAMIVTGFRNDEIWGYTVDIYIVNKTQNTLMFAVDSATINGFMCDPFWACEVNANTCAYHSISWLQDELDSNGITDVEEILLALRVYDSNDWMADAVIDQQYTINP